MCSSAREPGCVQVGASHRRGRQRRSLRLYAHNMDEWRGALPRPRYPELDNCGPLSHRRGWCVRACRSARVRRPLRATGPRVGARCRLGRPTFLLGRTRDRSRLARRPFRRECRGLAAGRFSRDGCVPACLRLAAGRRAGDTPAASMMRVTEVSPSRARVPADPTDEALRAVTAM